MHMVLGRIKLAATLAVGFLALRLAYAFIFAGLGGNQVLFSIPQLELTGPFRHITLFGEVSFDGIIRNLEMALPFAAAIVLFGLLSAFISPAVLLRWADRLKPIRNLLTTLAISLSALPGVMAAAKEASWTRKIRGEKRSAMMVPILERMVQKATAIGYELGKSNPTEPKAQPLIIKDFRAGNLGPINFSITPGQIVLISGQTGSGKSTLLQAIAGELHEHHGRTSTGGIFLGNEQIKDFSASSFVALVPQLPQLSFVSETVAKELGEKAIAQNLMSTSSLADKPTHSLSHGEAYRVALARAVSRKPSVLLIDEPSAALDSAGIAELGVLVQSLSRTGTTVLIADHQPELLLLQHPLKLEIANGELGEPKGESLGHLTPRRVVVGSDRAASITLDKLGRDGELLNQVSIQLRQAQCIAITGPNGSGKSSLLRKIAQPEAGELRIHNTEVLGANPQMAALVPDRPTQFFVTDSLASEMARADKIANAKPGLTQLTLESILGQLPDLKTHPLDTSVGTQLALSVAMQLSHKPQLLLLDEPVQGLDAKARELMAETIRCVQETGCAVLMATHDIGFARSLSDKVLEIRDRELRELSEVSA